MDKKRVIIQVAVMGVLFAVGAVGMHYILDSMLVVVGTFVGLPLMDAGLSWIVVFFGPAIIVVVFAQAFREFAKLGDQISGDDAYSKINALEKRIKDLEKDKADG